MQQIKQSSVWPQTVFYEDWCGAGFWYLQVPQCSLMRNGNMLKTGKGYKNVLWNRNRVFCRHLNEAKFIDIIETCCVNRKIEKFCAEKNYNSILKSYRSLDCSYICDTHLVYRFQWLRHKKSSSAPLPMAILLAISSFLLPRHFWSRKILGISWYFSWIGSIRSSFTRLSWHLPLCVCDQNSGSKLLSVYQRAGRVHSQTHATLTQQRQTWACLCKQSPGHRWTFWNNSHFHIHPLCLS